MADKSAYQAQVEDIESRAAKMRTTLIDPFMDDSGQVFIPKNRSEAKHRNQILESAIKGTVYEMAQGGAEIAGFHAHALQGYYNAHKKLPPTDLMASCHKAIENALLLTSGHVKAPGVFEAASLGPASDMSTTEGIIMRNRLVSLVLPVWLQSITANMVTFIPGDFNRSEFFRIRRSAGSTFGDFQKGDIIDYDYNGLYSVMDHRITLGTGDGTTKTFNFNSTTKYGSAYPLKKERVRIYHDRTIVAQDTGSGALAGTFNLGTTTVVVSGTVDYTAGTVAATFSVAPATGIELHIGFDVDIEVNPALIPQVDHKMWSRVLLPHESAIAGNLTIQALWGMRRELGQDIDNLTMQALRNLLAADKDRKHLRDMEYYCRHSVEWERVIPTALTMREHYETISAALLEVDSVLMNANGVAGLTGIVGGNKAVNIMRYLGSPWFEVAPGYRSIAQPHYVGKIFGFDLYCNPQMQDWECLCFSKGPNHGETSYVAGDAVPALTFRHPIMGDLVQRMTMWDLSYRDLQPFDGADYLCKLKFTQPTTA